MLKKRLSHDGMDNWTLAPPHCGVSASRPVKKRAEETGKKDCERDAPRVQIEENAADENDD
jgi:hypothetical protein